MNEDKVTKKLSDEQLRVLRDKATEAPFTGEHLFREDDGVYTCAACDTELFRSNNKFEAHCGWPAFYDIASSDAVRLETDDSHGMSRTEVLCKNCGGHLGHLFDDAPDQPTGQRYCINSLSLDFKPKA
jgi:peptide-methionine (R)-S-oxide reductase